MSEVVCTPVVRARHTFILHDQFCHAESSVCGHLHGPQMPVREAKDAKFSSAIPRRIIAWRASA